MTIERDPDAPRIRRAGALPEPRIVGRRPAAPRTAEAPPAEPVAAASEVAAGSDEEAPRARTRRGTRGGRGRGGASAPGTAATAATAAAGTTATPAASAATAASPADAPVIEELPVDAAPAPAPAPRRSTARATRQEAAVDLGAVGEVLRGVQTLLEDLDRRMSRLERRQRLGVFVDVPNVIYGAERGERMINMGKLLDLLSEGRDLVRATAYSPVSDDPGEPIERQKFVAPFVPHEYRIVTKPLKRFADGSIKGNFDVEMAVDMVTMAERLDVICLVSGDADFSRVVEVLQGRGVRVEVVAFENSTSAEMRAIADHYIDLSAVVDRLR